MDPKMDELFAYLRTAFDFIVIDTAPVGLVSDARILGRFADASIYVIRQRYTLKKQLANIQEIYSKKLLPNLGILVNDVKIKGINSYYGYGRTYGYGYGGYGSNYHYHYAYGYGTEKKSFFRTLLDKFKGK
jgi:Mrp family chromosome partitioning ATPase